MNAIPFLLAAVLAFAGCVGKPEAPAEADAAAIEPAGDGVAREGESEPPAPPSPEPEPAAEPAPHPPHGHEEPEETAPEAPEPRVDVAFWNGTITGAGASPPAGPACCLWREADGQPGKFGTFEVPAGLKGIVVELAWTHAQSDLDLALLAPDYEETIPPEPDGAQTSFHKGHAWSATGGMTGQPDGHARIVVTDAEALALVGGWAWRVGTEAGQDVPYAVAVSLFFDAPPADDHAALADPSGNP